MNYRELDKVDDWPLKDNLRECLDRDQSADKNHLAVTNVSCWNIESLVG